MSLKTTTKTLLKAFAVIVALVFLNEYLFRLKPTSVILWLLKNPLLFIMNVSLISAFFGLILFLTKRIHWTLCIVATACISIAVVNANKFNLRSVPISFEDFFLIKEIWVLLPQLINSKSILALTLALPILFIMHFLIKKWLGNITFDELKKPTLKILAVSFAFLMMGQVMYTNDLDPWETGLIYSLSNGLRKSPTINQEILENIQDILLTEVSELEDDPLTLIINTQNPMFKPNIIVIMSEAFWDVNKLNLDFSQDPLPFFNRIKSESISGEIYVPVFGGGTANTEYEVLTGLTLKNYPTDWYVVYRDALDVPKPSMASILSDLGYETIALHPYYPWYYRRNEVYPLLGFDRFISIEDMEDADLIGPFISDGYVTDQIISLIEKNEKPIFNFTVTMQNHGPYTDDRYSESVHSKIKVDNTLDETVQDMIETYATGLYYSDLELKRLVSYIRASKEPTLLVFFGDHLPMLGEDYLAYRETNYIDEEPADLLKDDVRMMSVPYIIWANYPIESDERPLMNASYLTPLILRSANLPLPAFLGAVELLSNEAPLILRTGYWDDQYVFHPADTETYEKIRAFYHTLQEIIQ